MPFQRFGAQKLEAFFLVGKYVGAFFTILDKLCKKRRQFFAVAGPHDQVRLGIFGRQLGKSLWKTAGQNSDNRGIVPFDPAQVLPDLFVAVGGDGTGVYNDRIRVAGSVDDFMAARSKQFGHCGGFKAVDLAAEGIQKNFHRKSPCRGDSPFHTSEVCFFII